MKLGIERVVTHGTFELDGGSWEVDNNIWIVGDGSEVIVIDAAHDAKAIEDAVAGRHVVAVVCTHGHNDHITVAPQLAADLDAPVLLNPADTMLWEMTHGDKEFRALQDGQVLTAGGIALRAIATPGHSPGSTCLYGLFEVNRAGVRWWIWCWPAGRGCSGSVSGAVSSRCCGSRRRLV